MKNLRIQLLENFWKVANRNNAKHKRAILLFALVIGFFVLTPFFSFAARVIGFDQIQFGSELSLNASTISIYTANTSRIYITNSGLIGIGTTSPNQRLVVIGTANITAGLNVTGGIRVSELNAASCDVLSDTEGNFYCGTNGASTGGSSPWNSSGTNVYLNNSNAKIGIGTNNPTKKLSINGTIDAVTIDPSASPNPLINTTGNNLTISSASGSVIIRLG